LVYEVHECDHEIASAEHLSPTPDDWCEFVYTLRRIRVDCWHRKYEAIDVHDGTKWHVYLAADDVRISSSGSDEYPEEFEGFLEAVRQLSKGREFR